MSRMRRRSTKAETRLETLEGRITPAVMSPQAVIGAEILVLAPDSGGPATGLTRAESRSLEHYEQIRNPIRAVHFLNTHHRLAMWLDHISYYPGAPISTTPTPANNGATATTQTPGTTPGQSGPGSTTPSSSTSNPGTTTTTPAQGVVDATPADSTTAGDTAGTTGPADASLGQPLPASLDATLTQIYQSYEAGTIDQTESQFSKMAVFSGNSVEVQIHGNGGNFQELLDEVVNLDPQISVSLSDATYQMIIAYVPIADLASLVPDADHLVQSVTAQPPPVLN